MTLSQQDASQVGSITSGSALTLSLSNGGNVTIHNRDGRLFFEAAGVMTHDAFGKVRAYANTLAPDARDAFMEQETGKVIQDLSNQAGAVELSRRSEIGYVSFLLPLSKSDFLMKSVQNVTLTHAMIINPVNKDKDGLFKLKALSQQMNQSLQPKANPSSPNESTTDFSGLERIHAPEFVKQAQSDIGGGVIVDGSSVKIGITDTGITYNHPTFLDNDGKTVRIAYMRDFSQEGRVYFSPKANLSARLNKDGTVAVDAQVIMTPPLPALPAGDRFTEVKMNLTVPKDLAGILTAPNTPARLGAILEGDFIGPEASADIRHDGNTTDVFPMIFIPGDAKAGTKDRVYVDFTGSGNFTGQQPLRDWNSTADMVQVADEKIGFDIRSSDQLPKADGSAIVNVYSASIVGFDPGNHGSHVSGIAAGRQTIANDSGMTLARGVAPKAWIMMNRVCSNAAGCNDTAGIIDMAEAGAQVINMSLGALTPSNNGYGVDETVIDRLTSLYNVLFVTAAGNDGPARETIGTPADSRLSLSVGATASVGMIQRQYQWPALGNADSQPLDPNEDRDFMLYFSSRGPLVNGGFKPEIVAPGTELSSVQLDAAPGANAGLDVYWGTSMATPTVAGSYALLLDAIQKYNTYHPGQKLATDALTLRRILVESARAFDEKTLDTSTGQKTAEGEYTWIDEGHGIVDLSSAWKMLFSLRDAKLAPSLVDSSGNPIEPDYQVLISETSPDGAAYNGTQSFANPAGGKPTPEFGSGIYLSYSGTDTLRQVNIARRLPEIKMSSADAVQLEQKLETTTEEFVLKTVISGSNTPWVKAGVLWNAGPDCMNNAANDLTLIGRGAEIAPPKSAAPISSIFGGALNVCIDRQAMETLPPGDHGALISAYRKTNGVVSPIASFTVPVYVVIPQKTLAHSTGYDIQGTVDSFQVSRNYVEIPKGTGIVQITLEAPQLKLDGDGQILPGQKCSQVLLMAMDGDNTDKIAVPAKNTRVANCKSDGSLAEDSSRVMRFTQIDPKPGIWDIHIMGMYEFAQSQYTLKVDYITATGSENEITGDASSLTGSLAWTVQGASETIALDPKQSVYELTGLQTPQTGEIIVPKAFNDVPGLDGKTGRSYSPDVQSVTFHIGNCPGNDIDLYVYECNPSAASHTDASCALVGKSDGPTDVETVANVPIKPGKVYIANVEASTVKAESTFDFSETENYAAQPGTLAISGNAPAFTIDYGFSPAQLSSSALLQAPRFLAGKSSLIGDLTLDSSDGSTLASIPVSIAHTASTVASTPATAAR